MVKVQLHKRHVNHPHANPTVLLLLLALLISACTSPSNVAAPAAQPASAAEAANASEAGAFPVTIAHKYGSTDIVERPERIVVVGLTEQDALLALGVTPVGTTEWFGGYPGAIWPWAQPHLGDAKPELVGDGGTIKFETIAALRPDVIVALYAGLTQEQYDLLSQIAPTVAQPAEYVDYGIPWQEATRKVGQIVGKTDQAEQLIQAVEDRFAQVRADHPAFQDASAVVATPYQGVWVYGSEDVRSRLLTALGFKLPDELDAITGAEFGGNISLERADLLDVDTIIWLDAADTEGPLGGPLYETLNVHKEGREVFLDSYNDPLGGATSFVSVLSLPFLLDGLTPKLAAAIDGDPTTQATDSAAPPVAATRVITDALGRSVTVPANPVRIVTLSEQDLDGALALGLTPVGSVNGRGQTGLPLYLGEQITGIASVGALAEPSLETIVALHPDLILAGTMIPQIEALLPELGKIAPVVATQQAADDWKAAFLNVAHLLNREAEAAAFFAGYDERAAAVQAQLPAGEANEVNVARWMPEGPVVMMPTTFSSLVLADVGLARPAAIETLAGGHGAHSEPLSLELLNVMDSDWLFLGTLNAEGAAALETAMQNPLFQQLDVVQKQRVTAVDGAVWTSVGGPLAAMTVLDDIEKALANQ